MNRPAVLFVDDDAGMHDAYAELLRLAGFAPVCVATGRAAVSAAARVDPVLIVVHLWDGDPEGFDTAWALKAARRTRGTPIVALVGPAGHWAARHAGCDVVVRKPMPVPRFIEMVRELAQDRFAEERRADIGR